MTLRYKLRPAITELVDWFQEWDDPDPQVMIQALWIIALAGAENSQIHWSMTAKVLRLMQDVAHGRVHPNHALELLKGWETT